MSQGFQEQVRRPTQGSTIVICRQEGIDSVFFILTTYLAYRLSKRKNC